MKKYFLVIFVFWAVLGEAKDVEIRSFPAPDTVSPEIKSLVSGAPFPFWNDHPKTKEAWKAWVDEFAEGALEWLPQLREQMQVSVAPITLGGVPGFVVTPKTVLPENQSRVLLHFHGGGYVLNPGEAGTKEAIMMAGFGNIKVLSIDYRMPPDFPFPAAIDDALVAYRELLKTYPPEKIGVFGTSTGGGMALALLLRANMEGLPLPGAVVAGTPWTDMSKTGDSYFTLEGIDNVLVSYDGWLGEAARLYANGHDLKDPLLSPIYGDVKGFPPIQLVTGTRDLFLSNTVRMHVKLREANVVADLIVLEGLSHAHYLMTDNAPETKLYFREASRFFNQHLAK